MAVTIEEVTQFTYFQQVGGLDCKPVLEPA